MVALTARGRETDIQALAPWNLTIDEVEKRLRAAPMRGEPYPRSCVLSLYMQTDPEQSAQHTFETAMAAVAVESDTPGEKYFDAGTDYGDGHDTAATHSWVIENDEDRLDVQDGKVLRTRCFAELRPMIQAAHLAKQLGLFVRVLDVKFAFSFRTDSPEHFRYLDRGLGGGLPDWLFTLDGSTITVHEGTPENVAKLRLAPTFPHLRW